MSKPFLSLCLVGLAINGVLCVGESGPATEEEDNDLTKLRDRIFSMGSPSLEPDEVFEILLELKEAYQKAGVADEWYEKVNSYLSARQVSEGNCKTGHFKKLAELAKLAKELSFNLVDYMEELRLRQLELCRVERVELVEKAIAQIGDDTKKDMSALKEAITSTMPSGGSKFIYGDINNRYLYLGLIDYINLANKQEIDTKQLMGKNGLTYWRLKFRKHIVYMCAEVLNKINWAIDLYLTLTDSIPLMARIDDSTFDWIEKVNVCKKVEEKEEDLIRGTFESVKAKSKRNRCFGLF